MRISKVSGSSDYLFLELGMKRNYITRPDLELSRSNGTQIENPRREGPKNGQG